MNKNIYSVSRVNNYIKNMFSEDFMLRNISVKGEVSNCKYHTSGHVYFTIKDQGGELSAVLFANQRSRGLRFPMKNGDQVIITGSISVYEKGGTYQIYAREISLDGAGDLYLQFEQLKKELEEMGMFAPEYKKPIPKYAKRIGIVTASTGAAVRDIIQISKRRNPYVELILKPTLVQGEGAVASIISGIQALDTMGLDIIIVGRGGGSIEDLWAFNEEEVARAIFNCETPIISAVGHETDTTISDYVADLRAPTPSAAAELAVFSYEELQSDLNQYQMALARQILAKLEWYQQRIEQYGKDLKHLSPMSLLREKMQYTMHLEQKLQSRMDQKLEQKKAQMALLAGRLDGVSPAKKLTQGYAFAVAEQGQHIYSVKQVQKGQEMSVYLQDGKLTTSIEEINEEQAWNKN